MQIHLNKKKWIETPYVDSFMSISWSWNLSLRSFESGAFQTQKARFDDKFLLACYEWQDVWDDEG